MIDYARNAFTQNPAIALGACVLLLVVALWLLRTALRKLAQGTRVFAKIVMLLALGWSAEVMFHIVRVTLHQGWGPTIAMFAVFEAAFVLAAQRAEQHMKLHDWPGHHLRTVYAVGAIMACVGLLASQSPVEAFIRLSVPIIAVKIWRDGLYDGKETRPGVSSWRWTPRNLAIWVGALAPSKQDTTEISRERLISRMVRLEFKRRHGLAKRRDTYAQRLMRLSLQADDAAVREVRSRVDRAQWFTVTPLRNGGRPAARVAAHVAQEPTQELAQIMRKPAQVLTHPGAQAADPGTAAAQLFLSGRAPSIREAARQCGVSEGTVRNRLARMDRENAQAAAGGGEPQAA